MASRTSGLETPHPAQPAIVAGSLAPHVLGNFRVRQNQEGLTIETFNHGVSNLLGLDRGGRQKTDAAAKRRIFEHFCAHALRAQRRYSQASVAVSDGKPFSETKGSVLGRRVWRRSDLIEKTGGRDGLQQVALTPLHHRRNDGARGVDVSHEVDAENPLPLRIGRLHAAFDADASIRAKEIDPAACLNSAAYEFEDVRFFRDVGMHGDSMDLRGNCFRPFLIDVRNKDGACAFGFEPAAKSASNSAGPAGHNRDCGAEFHSFDNTMCLMRINDLRKLVNSMPFNALVGIHVARLHSDGLTIECTVRDDLRNLAGVLHGGVLATLVDAAVGIALTRHFGGRRPFTTAELKINYTRPVKEGKVRARARLLKVGTKLCVGAVEVTNGENQLVAAALLSYMLL